MSHSLKAIQVHNTAVLDTAVFIRLCVLLTDTGVPGMGYFSRLEARCTIFSNKFSKTSWICALLPVTIESM